MTDTAKIWNRDAIIELLDRSDKAVAKALWTLYQRQTTDEQVAQETRLHNGRGFTAHDARFLSDIAARLPRYDFHMTSRQVAKVRPMLRKYWRQLLEEIAEKGGAVDMRVAKSRIREEAKAAADEIEDLEDYAALVAERAQQASNSLHGAF